MESLPQETERREELEWTIEWPTKPGQYWFYGFRWKDRDRPPKFYYVSVRKIANGFAYVEGHAFMYKAEKDYGVWAQVELPVLPSIPNEE